MLKGFTFALLLLTSVPTFAKTNQAISPSSVIRFKPSFPVSGLTKVDGDKLLIWNQNGQAQICDQHRNWSPVFRFPSQDLKLSSTGNSPDNSSMISELISDKLGILVLYDPDPLLERSHIFFLTGTGDKILDHWQVDSIVYSMISNGVVRSIITPQGVVPLLSQGRFGEAKAIPLEFPKGRHLTGVSGFEWLGTLVVCRDGNRTLAHHAPLQCNRLGNDGWQFSEWGRLEPLLVCGSWLLTWAERPENRLILHSLYTGKPEGKASLSPQSVMACSGNENLWVGGKTMQLLSLPDLKVRWRWPIKGKQVGAIAVLEKQIALKIEGEVGEKSEILIIPRPEFTIR